MEDDKLYYYGIDIDIRLGDRIIYKTWGLFKKKATVIYVPFQSKRNKSLGNDHWAISLDDDSENIITMGYFPEVGEVVPKKITFISRGIVQGIQSNEEFY